MSQGETLFSLKSLGCDIKYVDNNTDDYEEVKELFAKSSKNSKTALTILDVFKIERHKNRSGVISLVEKDMEYLFHGSRLPFWVFGLLYGTC